MSLLSLLFPLLRLIHPYISKGALFSNYEMRLNEWMTRRIMHIKENAGGAHKSSVTSDDRCNHSLNLEEKLW